MRVERRAGRPVALIGLTVLFFVEGVGALFGGIPMLVHPHEGPLGMPLDQLSGSPFGSFLIPGLLLTLVLGVYPLLAALLVWWRPNWKAMAPLERLTGRHWTWSVGVTAGLAMMIWIAVQVAMLEMRHPLQAVIAAIGLVVVSVIFMPGVRRDYAPLAERSRRRR